MSFINTNRKILYVTDGYAKNVAGIKMSLLREMRSRKFIVDEELVHTAGKNKIAGNKLLKKLKNGNYTDLWIVHTWVSYIGCTLSDINKQGVRVLGFGLSDPYEWDIRRLQNYNLYATHSRKLADSLTTIPTHYFTTCCDTLFHKDLNCEKSVNVLFIGRGRHPRFKDKNRRIYMMKKLLKIFPNIKIFGRDWMDIPAQPHVSGNSFLNAINSAKVSLDIEESFSPLAHRNFEFPACGTPIITKARNDVLKLKGTFPVYNTFDDLVNWLKRMLCDITYYTHYKTDMYNNVRKNHTIKNRVDDLLNFLDDQT